MMRHCVLAIFRLDTAVAGYQLPGTKISRRTITDPTMLWLRRMSEVFVVHPSRKMAYFSLEKASVTIVS
jgi:hypothetical protein